MQCKVCKKETGTTWAYCDEHEITNKRYRVNKSKVDYQLRVRYRRMLLSNRLGRRGKY